VAGDLCLPILVGIQLLWPLHDIASTPDGFVADAPVDA
jgi:hypothetical protein